MDTNVVLQRQKCSNKTKRSYGYTILIFYPLFDVKFVKNGTQLALVHAI